MKSLKVYVGLGLTILLLFALSCSRPQQESASGSGGLSPQETRQIAKEAYIYGFPLVTNYETLHKQAVDTTGHDYRAPFNTIASLANVATPEDKFLSRLTPIPHIRSFGWTCVPSLSSSPCPRSRRAATTRAN
jgi:hypothetical protein